MENNKTLILEDRVNIDEKVDIQNIGVDTGEIFDNLDNLSDDEINEKYDQLMNMSLLDTSETEEDKENIDEIEESYDTNIKDLNIFDKVDNVDIDEISSSEYDVDESQVKAILSDNDITDMKDIVQITGLIERRVKGEQFNPYPLFPEKIQLEINSQLAMMGKTSDRHSRSMIANMILDQMVEEYKSRNTMDLDDAFLKLGEDARKLAMETSIEMSDLYLELDSARREAIQESINKAEEKGDNEAAQKFKAIQHALDESIDLTDFAEYCKTVKIKKFDMEKPSRIYDIIYNKYRNHKNVINDISQCPKILDKHIKDNHEGNLKVCLAFCKYCANKSPDNIEDHTFMYYFIRNIIMLDRMNPNGENTGDMKQEASQYYLRFLNAIKKCISNIK